MLINYENSYGIYKVCPICLTTILLIIQYFKIFTQLKCRDREREAKRGNLANSRFTSQRTVTARTGSAEIRSSMTTVSAKWGWGCEHLRHLSPLSRCVVRLKPVLIRDTAISGDALGRQATVLALALFSKGHHYDITDFCQFCISPFLLSVPLQFQNLC